MAPCTEYHARASGRDDWTRTSDFHVPNVALYQAELRPVCVRPPKVLHGATSMAVRAADLTFRYFRSDPLPSPALLDEATDVCIFNASDVIELENAKIRLSTINTGMCKEIFCDSPAVAGTIVPLIDVSTFVVRSSVSPIMRFAVLALT
jgi:hypothetical protein